MIAFLLSWRKTQAQVHCQQVSYIMKESTSVLLQITTLHQEGKLAHASFPYSTCTSAIPKTTLHCESNLTHACIHFIMHVHHEQKLAPFIVPCDTSAWSKATLHREWNLTHAIFPSIVNAIQHMLAHFLAHAQVHCQN